MITSIVAAIVIFAVLIVVHEAGHFAMAKRLGVRVLRFSVGYPPRLFGVRYGETDYSLGATPFGGYVKMLGDEVAEEPSSATLLGYIKELLLDLEEAARRTKWIAKETPDEAVVKAIADELAGGYEASRAAAGGSTDGVAVGVAEAPAVVRAHAVLGREVKPEELILLQAIERSGSVSRACEILSEGKPSALVEQYNTRAFPSQPLAKRFAIVLAGPVSNIIFAPILMAVVFMVGVPTMLPVLGSIPKDLPGYAAGLQLGDRVVAVNSAPINTWDELSTLVKQSGGNPIKLTVERKAGADVASTLNLTVTPKRVDEPTIYGTKAPTWVIGVTPRGDEITHREGPIAAVGDGVSESVSMAGTLMVGIAKIISGATPVRQALGGPIMIAQIAGREAHQGFSAVAMFTVMLSLELGIINLFPVPLLDGGHLLFFVIEGVRGEPMKLRHREIAMQVGLFLLAILMAFVIVNDISRLIG